MKRMHGRFHAESGLSLVEIAISGTILLLLAASMIESVDQVGALGKAGNAEARMQQNARDAVASITEDLRAAGFVDANGKTYPYFYSDGVPTGPQANLFTAHAHAPAVENAEDDEPDFGPNGGIVFVRPTMQEVAQDSDGTNWDLHDENGDPIAPPTGVDIVKLYDFPVIGPDGTSGFQADEISYVLVTAADGVNELQRRVGGVLSRVIARGVERVLFEEATPGSGIPLQAVRMRLWLRATGEEGMVFRHFTEAVVRLQNGGTG